MSDERKTQVLVDGVRRTFQISGSELVVLDRIDLDIKEGEFISIVANEKETGIYGIIVARQ